MSAPDPTTLRSRSEADLDCLRARYVALETALLAMRESIIALGDATTRLPLRFQDALDARLVEATDALNLPEPVPGVFGVLRSLLAAHPAPEPEGSGDGWRDMASAPRDGTKIDLLYPYPRGRTIDCFWIEGGIFGRAGIWVWRTPKWDNRRLLPEEEWITHCYLGMQPLAWRPAPPVLQPSPEAAAGMGGEL